MVQLIRESFDNATCIAIGGHVRPDGDCVGSCLALAYYLRKKYPEKQIDVFLEYIQEEFCFLQGSDLVISDLSSIDNKKYDLFVSLDCGDLDRLGFSETLFHQAKKTINIDHHITNQKFAGLNYVLPNASSTCETLMDVIEESELDKELAQALYLGIIHDTGVFKHSNTTKKTMECAGKLITFDIPFSKIIDETFYQKTYVQNQIMGRCLLESFLVLDKRCIISYVKADMMAFYQASAKDLDGIIDQMRVTRGVEVAILIHETGVQTYKVSMRSNDVVDVSAIAKKFGGGGHIKASGCTMTGSIYDVINNITVHIEAQLNKAKDNIS